jgi:hypothetical protein
MHGDIIQVGRPPESSLIKLVTGESDLKKKNSEGGSSSTSRCRPLASVSACARLPRQRLSRAVALAPTPARSRRKRQIKSIRAVTPLFCACRGGGRTTLSSLSARRSSWGKKNKNLQSASQQLIHESTVSVRQGHSRGGTLWPVACGRSRAAPRRWSVAIGSLHSIV